ncbi:MAG TPA: M48 family metalloprotease [bacterium]|nr:M48 family metalloprotease [bacterium]HQG47145.1 M48 family metalloprotease [bacterium]HQJ63566.1 M48 family metalloprotease [bacterium]
MKKEGPLGILLTALLLLATGCAGSRKSGTLAFVSIEEEIALGKEVSVQAGQVLKTVRNQEVLHYLDRLAAEIGLQSHWSGLTYSVQVVNEPDLNHFSLPGGEIFLYRGMIESLGSSDQVAAVLAHEIAHIAARDGIERLAAKYGWAVAAQSMIGQNPEIARQLLLTLYTKDSILDYPKPVEREADRKCTTYLEKANFDPKGALEMLRILRQAESRHPSLVRLLRRTHASASSRYRHVYNDVKSLNSPDINTHPLADFLQVKEILAKIPY